MMSIKIGCKAIANALRFVWDWRFLAVANLAAAIYCLCVTIIGARPPKTIACNIDNPLMTNLYGIQRMSETAAQTMSAVHSIEHNTPDLTAPWIVVVLTVLWLAKTAFEEYRDGLTVVVTSVLTVLSVIAAGWGFIGGVAASQKLDGAARQITQSFEQIYDLQYEALKVADAQGESADTRKIRACTIALDMMSAERLRYCTSNLNIAGCFLTTTADSEKKAAIEAETQKWLFAE